MIKNLKTILLIIFVSDSFLSYTTNFEPTNQEREILQLIQNNFGGQVYGEQQKVNGESLELHQRFIKAIKERNNFISFLKNNENTFSKLHSQVATSEIENILKRDCINSDVISIDINTLPRLNNNQSAFSDPFIFQNLCKTFYDANLANCELLSAIKKTIRSAAIKFNPLLQEDTDYKALLGYLITDEKNTQDPVKISANSIFKITSNSNTRQAYFNLWINSGYLLKTMYEYQLPNLLYTNENAGLQNNKNLRHISNLYQRGCYGAVLDVLSASKDASMFYMIQAYEVGDFETNFERWREEWYTYIPQYIMTDPSSQGRFYNNISFPAAHSLNTGNNFYVQRVSDYGIIAGFAQDLFIDGVSTNLPKSDVTLNCFSFSNYKKIQMCNFGSNKKLLI